MNAGMVKKVIIAGIAFIIIGLAIGFGPQMLSGFEATRNDTYPITSVQAVTSSAGTPSANHSTIAFARPLLTATASYVTSITSNITGQTLTIASGTITTTSANVTGHTGAALQTLTIVYEYPTNQYYTGLSTVVGMGPTLILLGFIIFVGVVAFMGIRVTGKS